jgi:hypothetical protein
MRFVRLMALCLAACAPVVSSPSPTSSPIALATATNAPSATPAATASPNVPSAPQRSVVTLYQIDDVMRGSAQPPKRLAVDAPVYDMQFGPDPRWAIVSNVGVRDPLRLMDLETGVIASIALGLAPDALHQASTIRWLPDGRLLVTGGEIWIGGPRGENLTSVFATFPFGVVPSRSGTLLAITTHDSGAIIVLDLVSGATKTLNGPFRPCVQDGYVAIAWAPDDRALAATDCSDQAQGGMQTRFVTVADGHEIRSLAELSVGAWLPTGDVIARGPFRARAEPELWVIGPGGTRRSLPTFGFYLSPDGRYLLGSGIRNAPTPADPTRREHFAQLVEISTGRVLDVGEGMPAGWTGRGEIALVTLF